MRLSIASLILAGASEFSMVAANGLRSDEASLGINSKAQDNKILYGAGSEDTDDADRHLREAKCHVIGAYKTGISINVDIFNAGGNMVCHFPVDTDSTFPLLAFAHGYGGGGLAVSAYGAMQQKLASSGFVVCAYTQCWPWCPNRWPRPQLDLIAAARYLSKLYEDGPVDLIDVDLDIGNLDIAEVDLDAFIPLPIDMDSDVGVFGHSSGAISSIMSAYEDNADEYYIGAVMAYDGASINPKMNPDLDDLHPDVPVFMAASTQKVLGIPPQCDRFAKPNAEEILKMNPGQPLLVACIKGMDHHDNAYHIFRWNPPNKAVPYVAAFFGYTLDPSRECLSGYKDTLGDMLENSSSHYVNTMFDF